MGRTPEDNSASVGRVWPDSGRTRCAHRGVVLLEYTRHLAEVVGVYEAKYPSGTETLTLNEDGTFFQQVVLKEPEDATPVTREGTWTFDEETQTLNIPDCMLVEDNEDISPTFTTDLGCFYPVERLGIFVGPIALGGDAFPVTGVWSSGPGLRKK